MPLEAWEGYVEMRKTIKKPLTERAKKIALTRLNDLRLKGYDPSIVLDQSTFRCWQGLYPVKGEQDDGDGANRKTFDAIRRENTANALRRTSAAYQQVAGNLFRALPPGAKRGGGSDVH
jgi:hypothetical protein